MQLNPEMDAQLLEHGAAARKNLHKTGPKIRAILDQIDTAAESVRALFALALDAGAREDNLTLELAITCLRSQVGAMDAIVSGLEEHLRKEQG